MSYLPVILQNGCLKLDSCCRVIHHYWVFLLFSVDEIMAKLSSTSVEKSLKAFSASLEDLTFNSKPIIDELTRFAGSYNQLAPQVVQRVEEHILEVEWTLLCSYSFILLCNYSITFHVHIKATSIICACPCMYMGEMHRLYLLIIKVLAK